MEICDVNYIVFFGNDDHSTEYTNLLVPAQPRNALSALESVPLDLMQKFPYSRGLNRRQAV